MNIKELSSKQLAKEIIAKKVANKLNEDFIKEGLEELRNRGVNDITTQIGMIYSVDGSVRKQLNNTKINTYLAAHGKTLDEFKDEVVVEPHYAIKPSN